MGKIINGKDTPLSQRRGTVPDLSGSLKDKYQLVTFVNVSKSIEAFMAQEGRTNYDFWAVGPDPFSLRQLLLKPEGQRAWSWFIMIAEPGIVLGVDDVAEWNRKKTRVMALNDFSLNGFMEYHLAQDWEGAAP